MAVKQRTIHVSDEAWERMDAEAKAENRSISAYLDRLFTAAVAAAQNVDFEASKPLTKRDLEEAMLSVIEHVSQKTATKPATPRYAPARPMASRTPVPMQEGAVQRDDDGIEHVPAEDGP